ncbi:hypothetical protein [Litoribaculum gwangyangense]|uniref:Uncharacterized protein n=1 Tax=Litoribaculum gwangyangense TaxID=1130722 RepID=A0ABP9CVC9_9FLAO
MEKKKKKKIIYILQEIVIVAIGILIAVSISNYKENVDNQKYIEKTLLAIENEIKLSQTEVDSVLNRHIKLYEIIDNHIGSNEYTLSELITSSGGFQVASIKNVSLRFFISNKAELLEFQIISQLLDIESQTDILSDKIKRLADFVYDNLNERNDEGKIKFYHLLADVIDGEQTLLESYSRLLDDNKIYIKKHK